MMVVLLMLVWCVLCCSVGRCINSWYLLCVILWCVVDGIKVCGLVMVWLCV